MNEELDFMDWVMYWGFLVGLLTSIPLCVIMIYLIAAELIGKFI